MNSFHMGGIIKQTAPRVLPEAKRTTVRADRGRAGASARACPFN
jgi:hypothetical protein